MQSSERSSARGSEPIGIGTVPGGSAEFSLSVDVGSVKIGHGSAVEKPVGKSVLHGVRFLRIAILNIRFCVCSRVLKLPRCGLGKVI